ncbi:GGDEF domain-containing protein [Lysinibacillus sp. BW-2-10]|nr:GGDEF domain-containing protein [Lysinibacillus sp. BW-2-10]
MYNNIKRKITVFKQNGMKLRYVISLLVLIVILLTTFVNWYSSNLLFQETLAEKYLNKNYEYAQKMSLDTSVLIDDMRISLLNLAKTIGTENFTQEDMDKWIRANSSYFNSIFSADDTGVVQMMSPLDAGKSIMIGMKIEDDMMKQFLKEKKPIVSNPYISQAGNYLILISHPIFDETGTYKGLVAGTVYIYGDNSLMRLLAKHDLLDDSSSFVVDQNGMIIFHKDPSKVNTQLDNQVILNKLTNKKGGSIQSSDNAGNDYFTGYAYMPNTGWGIVSQTPVTIMNQPLKELSIKMIVNSLPLLIILLVLTVLVANRIASPLTRLAEFSRQSITKGNTHETTNKIHIKSKITEVKQLYYDIQEHLQILTDQNQKDGLTGLANRRTFDSQIKEWVDHQIPFSLIMLDIDRFKKVNDTYGHLVGDDVLKFLAKLLQESCRTNDRCFRYGGEEFIILLKNIDANQAYDIAERLRIKIEQTVSPTGEPINISLGITSFKENDIHPTPIIERADTALYHSKETGRNKTTVYEQIKSLK